MRELAYSGAVIRDRNEMLCLTDMWKAAGSPESKRPAGWAQKESAREFIGYIASEHNVLEPYIITEKGRAGGTWAHWQIALAYAKYLSPEFHAWCNEVVRDHMEGRNLPPETLPAVVASEQNSLIVAEQIGQAIGERIVRRMDERFDAVDNRFDVVDHRQKSFDDRLTQIEKAVTSTRRNLNEKTKNKHIRAAQKRHGICPCCNQSKVIDEKGEKTSFAHFDHWRGKTHNSVRDTWLICAPCNQGFENGRLTREEKQHAFNAYQQFLREVGEENLDLFGTQ